MAAVRADTLQVLSQLHRLLTKNSTQKHGVVFAYSLGLHDPRQFIDRLPLESVAATVREYAYSISRQRGGFC